MLRTLLLLLLTCGCALAGQVKTFDGLKLDEDSVATLKVYAQIGKEHQPTTIFVFAVKIDTLRLYDQVFSGVDYALESAPAHVRQFENLLIDAGMADNLDKVRLTPSPHTVHVQCLLRYNQKMTGEYGFSKQVPLTIEPLQGHKYEVRARCEDAKWTIWIQDQKTKAVVSTATDSK